MSTIQKSFDAILQKPGVKAHAPARDADFDAFEKAMGIEVPYDLREMLSISNGAELSSRFRLLSLKEAEPYGRSFYGCLQLLALTDEDDSNPYCLICASPFEGMIVHLYHDDDSRLCFGSLGDFLEALQIHGAGEILQHENVRKDISVTCLEALEWTESNSIDEDSRNLLLSMAFSGLGAGYEARIQVYLEDEDPYVREFALNRLREIDTPAAKKILYDDSLALERLVSDTRAVLTAAGFELIEQRQSTTVVGVRAKNQPLYWDMAMFFSRRNEAGIFQELVDRTKNHTKNR